MMRTSQIFPILFLCAATLLAPLAADAQQPAAPGKDVPPPPQMQKLEEGEAPAIKISPSESKTHITEKRAPGGKVTEAEVKSGGSLYTLKPNDQVGSSQPGDAESTPTRGAAQWKVMSFGPNKSQQEPQENAAPATPAAPTSATDKK